LNGKRRLIYESSELSLPVLDGACGRQRVQTPFSIADQKAMQVPAGVPVLGSSSSSNRQLAGDGLENSNASTGHAPDSSPPPDAARPAIAAPALAPLAPPRRPPVYV
jgi:hypothetical protein